VAARNALAWEPPAFAAANTWSWVTLGVGVGGVALTAAAVDTSLSGKGGRAAAGHFFEDFFTILEPAVVAMDLNQVVKMVVARQRPYAHYKDDTTGSPEDDLSFFSEHTAAAFALATASGTVFTMRGYRWAPIVWGSGMIFATLTARLRIAADRHYLSDVLVGSAFGSATGFLMPYFLHRPGASPPPVALAVSASHDGGTVAASGTW
jgi:membrane-associated phospholipid phosphatase